MLQKGVEGGALFGGGQALLIQEAGPLQNRVLGLVGEGSHTDLGGHLGQRRGRVLPGKAAAHRLQQRFVRRALRQPHRAGGGGLGEFVRLQAHGEPVRQLLFAHRGLGHDLHLQLAAEALGLRVGHGGLHHPLAPAGAVLQQIWLRRAGEDAQGQLLGQLQGVFGGHGHDQLVPRTGEGHIQHPHLLAQALLGKGGLHRPVGSGHVGSPLPGPQGQADAQLRVEHRRGPKVLLIEFPAQIGGEHHRELQSLGPVHRHNGHAAGAALALLRAGHAVPRQGRVHCPHHTRQTMAAAAGGKGGELAQVLPPGAAVRHGARRGKAAGAGKNLLHQPVHRHGLAELAQGVQPLAEGLHLFVLAGHHRAVKAAVFAAKAQVHQIVRGEAAHAAEHHRRQMYILSGVVQHP